MNKYLLAKDVKTIRKSKNISIYRMSKDTKLSMPTIYSIEKGNSDYRIDKFLTYLNYLGLDITLIKKTKSKL